MNDYSYLDSLKTRIYTSEAANTVRAAIYARVSTDNESQKESCANQVELARLFISQHPNIILVGTYVDDGISGKSEYGRLQYSRLLQDIETGKIDLVISKSLSRLNRNELNSYTLIELLCEKEATIYTLEDNCLHNLEDRKERLYNTLKIAMDADYVYEQSQKGRKTHELRCKHKQLSAKDTAFGYVWDSISKTISIDPQKINDVVFIYEEYVYRHRTPYDISRALKAKGIILSPRSINNILQSERYIGRFYINKTSTKLMGGKRTSKKIQKPKDQWILVERPDLSILDIDLFNAAQKERYCKQLVYKTPTGSHIQARYMGTHKYAGKIFCAICKKPYHFSHDQTKNANPIYRLKRHSDCPNKVTRVDEKDLDSITENTLSKTIGEQDEICSRLIKTLTQCYKEATKDSSVAEVKKQKDKIEAKIDNYVESLSAENNTSITREKILEKINSLSLELETINAELKSKASLVLDDKYIDRKMTAIKSSLSELTQFKHIDRDRVLTYIDKFYIQETGDIQLYLKSSIESGLAINNQGDDHVKLGNIDDLYS